MTFRKIPARELLNGCAEIGSDDGRDPRYDRPDPPAKVPNRKALQLCGQVARTLASVLAYECADEVLRDLVVESVTPAPTSVRLLVTVSRPPGREPVEDSEVLRRLEQARAMLRCQVAAAIHRRKAPELLFRIDRR